MNVKSIEKHEREVFVQISKDELEQLIISAVAAQLKMLPRELDPHCEVKVEPNMVGSPGYQCGYKATVRAIIPLVKVEAAP